MFHKHILLAMAKLIAKNSSQDFVDEHRRTIHRQYEVDWEDENKYFTSRLEAHWVPFQTYETKPGFDFGISSSTMHLGGEDEERILAFSFLRFREETGMPFRLGNVVEDTKAAGGAAERIALYCPLWAILTVVRTDEEKYMEKCAYTWCSQYMVPRKCGRVLPVLYGCSFAHRGRT